MAEVSRRDFLKLARDGFLYLSGVLALGGVLRFLDFELNPAPKTEFDLGPASNYTVDSDTLIPEAAAVILRNESGFTALSLVCTHLGCTVEQKPDGLTCPCHGSRYDQKGIVLRGPAKKALRALRIETTSDGRLILHTD